MPSSRLVQKSQEHVYVRVGRGSRARYRPVAVDLPQSQASTSIAEPASDLRPPVVSPPADPADGDGGAVFDDDVEGGVASDAQERPKRTGKVSSDT
jgi:hypothetical protein